MISVTQSNFSGGVVSPSMFSRIDFEKYSSSLEIMNNFYPLPHGEAENRAGTYFVRETKYSNKKSRLVKFQFSYVQSYVLEVGDLYIRYYKDGGIIVSSGNPVETVTPFTEADLESLKFEQSADTLIITSPNHPPYKLTRSSHTSWTLTQITLEAKITAPTNLLSSNGSNLEAPVVTITTPGGGVSGYWLVVPYNGSAAGIASKAFTAKVGSVINWPAVTGATSYRIFVWTQVLDSGYYSYKWYNVGNNNPTSSPYTLPSYSSQYGTGSAVGYNNEATFCVTAVSEGEEESLPSNIVPGSLDAETTPTTLSWGLVTDAKYYKIYGARSGYMGYVGKATNGALSFTIDTNGMTPDYTQGPPAHKNPFDAADKYPGCALYHQQRLIYARTNSKPGTFFGSTTGNFENFNASSPIRSDDAFEFPINGANEIRFMLSLQYLIMLTADREYLVSGAQGEDSPITPSSVKVVKQSDYGCANIQPVVSGTSVVFVDGSKRKLRDLSYSLQAGGYTGDDLTILASHLFEEAQIVNISHEKYPNSIIWAVLSNGALAGITYLKEHKIWGWHYHTTKGKVEDVCSVVNSAGVSDTYILVNRTIEGDTKRYVEMKNNRNFSDIKDAYFVDCGLTYNGTPTSTVSGLDHLEGEEVSVFADGGYVGGKIVQSGAITLPYAAGKIHVGLPYVGEIQTLNLDYPTQEGTMQDKKRQIYSAILRVRKSREFMAGPNAERAVQVLMRTNDVAYGDPTPAYSGDVEVSPHPGETYREDKLYIRVDLPVPVTVQAIIARIDNGEN